MQDVDDDVQPWKPRVERVAGDRRHGREAEGGDERRDERAAVHRRGGGEGGDDERDDEARSQRRSRAGGKPGVVRLVRSADGGEYREGRYEQRQPLGRLVRLRRRPPDDEGEERETDRAEQAGEEEPAGGDAARGRSGRERCERRPRGRSSCADGERDHAGLEMSVVRDDRPAHGVVAVAEPGPQRHDQRVAAADRGLAAEDRAAAVPHGRDSGSGADGLVEDDPHLGGRAVEHRPVRRRRAHDARMSPRRSGQRERRERGGREGGATGHSSHSTGLHSLVPSRRALPPVRRRRPRLLLVPRG